MGLVKEVEKMKISCLLRTSEYRGDHASDCTLAVEIQPSETVESLCERLLKSNPKFDWVELRKSWAQNELND